MKKLVLTLTRRMGYDIVRQGPKPLPDDISDSTRRIIEAVRPYTLTGPDRLIPLIDSVRFIVRNQIPGDVAECGVFRGGSMMAVALTLLEEGEMRDLYLYDTFEGMTEPTDFDRRPNGDRARDLLKSNPSFYQCISPIVEVRSNLASTGYPEERLHYIKGKVEDTIPANSPSRLSLLRLDTDWYESTRHELKHLFPLLNERGFLIIDDYGWWEGSKKAVDEFLIDKPYFLHRIGPCGRMLIK